MLITPVGINIPEQQEEAFLAILPHMRVSPGEIKLRASGAGVLSGTSIPYRSALALSSARDARRW